METFKKFEPTPVLSFDEVAAAIQQTLQEYKKLDSVVFYIPKKWEWMKYAQGWSKLPIPEGWHKRIWEGSDETHVRIRYTKE